MVHRTDQLFIQDANKKRTKRVVCQRCESKALIPPDSPVSDFVLVEPIAKVAIVRQ